MDFKDFIVKPKTDMVKKPNGEYLSINGEKQPASSRVYWTNWAQRGDVEIIEDAPKSKMKGATDGA